VSPDRADSQQAAVDAQAILHSGARALILDAIHCLVFHSATNCVHVRAVLLAWARNDAVPPTSDYPSWLSAVKLQTGSLLLPSTAAAVTKIINYAASAKAAVVVAGATL
jgi:hypothetical protein